MLGDLLRRIVPEFHAVGVHETEHTGSATVVAFPSRNARKI